MNLSGNPKHTNYQPVRGEAKSGRYKYIRDTLDDDVDKILNSPYLFQVQGMKIIVPSVIIGFWTKLEVLLGLKLSGHTNSLTETSNLRDQLYKRGKIQTGQQ